MSKRKVAVLMGGNSAERAVSLSTGRQILNALDPDKYSVFALDTEPGRPLPAPSSGDRLPMPMLASDGTTKIDALTELARVRSQDRPDVVVIALHGPGGEDGTVQGMLDVFRIPYTGSGVLASAVAMNKAMCKRVLMSAGVLMPRDTTLTRADSGTVDSGLGGMPLPWVVKPNAQGSTIGMTIIQTAEELPKALATAFEYDGVVLVEQFVQGTEITVPVIGNDDLEVLPIVEIVPASGFYDYEAKYTPGATDEIVPARISDSLTEKARGIAQVCHRTLGCRGMSRTDMIVAPSGDIYVLEVNTIPGMTPTSLLPRAAGAAGIAFPSLLDRLISLALEPR